MKIRILFWSFCLGIIANCFGNTIYTHCDGNWNDRAIWQGGMVPAPGDIIYVGHNVRLTSDLNLNNNFLNVSPGAEICGLFTLNVDAGSFVTVNGVARLETVNLNDSMIINGTLYTNLFVISGFLTINGGLVIGWDGACAPANGSTINATACAIYISPSGIYNWTSSGTYFDTLTSSSGCDSIITVNLIILPNSITINKTQCESYLSPSGNYLWTNSGTYFDTLQNSLGCDSVIIIHLTINNPSSDTISRIACNYYTSPSSNYTWTNSGTYFDTVQNSFGCDSIIIINLTILNSSTSDTIFVTTCDSFFAAGAYQHISGLYYDTLISALGCDSVIITQLDVASLSLIYSITNAALGLNDGAVKVIVSGGTPPYQFSLDNISFQPSSNFTELDTGTYRVFITDSNGCLGQGTFTIAYGVGIPYVDTFSFIKVFPNPFSDELFIELEKETDINLKLIDVLGRVVLASQHENTSTIKLNVTHIPQGVYYLEILNNKGEKLHTTGVQIKAG